MPAAVRIPNPSARGFRPYSPRTSSSESSSERRRFVVYLRTLLPDVGGPEDSPKFQYLGAVLGTAHPPGLSAAHDALVRVLVHPAGNDRVPRQPDVRDLRRGRGRDGRARGAGDRNIARRGGARRTRDGVRRRILAFLGARRGLHARRRASARHRLLAGALAALGSRCPSVRGRGMLRARDWQPPVDRGGRSGNRTLSAGDQRTPRPALARAAAGWVDRRERIPPILLHPDSHAGTLALSRSPGEHDRRTRRRRARPSI